MAHQSVKVEESGGEGYGPIYRSARSPNALTDKVYDGVDTLYDVFQRGLQRSRGKQFLGTRVTRPDGSKGEYKWMTYGEAEKRISAFSSGLHALGVVEKSPLGVYSTNRAEWVLSEISCYYRNARVVSLYDTLGKDAVAYILNHADIQVAVASKENIGKLLDVEDAKDLRVLISMDDVLDEAQVARAKERGIELLTMAAVEQMGTEKPVAPTPPTADDLSTIMYTSGTTGMPKGVMLKHAGSVGFLAGVRVSGVVLNENDVHVSYLPMAHIFERVVQAMVILEGGSMGFWQGSVPKLFEDIAELRPSIFPSVPRLFNRLYDKVINAVNDAAGTKKYLFNWGFNSKKYYVTRGEQPVHGVWDRLVFNKIRARLGGRVRMIITGSAPISPDVFQFLQICFCCPVIQGYGLTETCAGLTATWSNDTTCGHVGPPLSCNEVCLQSVPDMNYDALGSPPAGEVCVRGSNVMVGYYKSDEQTAEALKDGWFHTGDIARVNPNGTLTVIDRKKSMFKLSQGEYVSPEYIESVYLKSPYVQQCFVYGDSLKSSVVAIAVPDPDTLLPWAKNNGKPDNMKDLCALDDVRDFIAQELASIGKEVGLKGYEQAKAIAIIADPFSVEDDLLTPTFKMKRPQMKKYFQELIDKLYEGIA